MGYPTSGPIICSSDGQVIQNLDITNLNGNAIDTNGHSNIIIKNVIVRHYATAGTTTGIYLHGGSNNSITSADIMVQPPFGATAPLPFEMDNIYIQNSPNATVTNVRLTQGSCGIYCINSNNCNFSFIEGHEQWGPFPRGQLVQWGGCTGGSLSDFSNKCDINSSWTEDNVNVFNSTGINIQRGLIDGNNSGSGQGLLFDKISSGTVDSVDAIHWCAAGFGVYASPPAPQGHDVVMTNVRVRDSYLPIPTFRGGGTPSSGGIAFDIGPYSGSNIHITGSYHALANPGGMGAGGIKYNAIGGPDDTISVTDVDFTPRAAIVAQLQREAVSDKNFVVKNGLVVNTSLLTAFGGQIGINTTNPDANLTVSGTSNLNGNVAVSGILSTINVKSSFINVAGTTLINSTAIALGANVSMSTTTIQVGNTILTSALLNIGNSTVNSTVNSTTIVAGPAAHNTSGFFVGGNAQLNTTSLLMGNTTINSVVNSTALSLNGQTLVSSPAFLSLNPNTNINWNMALGFNASFQINTAAIFQAPTNYVVGASYSIYITQANGGNKSLTFSTSGVSFDFGAAGTPILSTTSGAVDFIFMIPYQANSFRCVFNKSALT